MNIGALQKFSLIEYPGKICAIVFTQGCNFRCPYCHNRELVDPEAYGPTMAESDVFSFLEKRKKKLDAVTVTGGEPTLQPDIFSFLEKLKMMEYLTKVDSNGSRPDVLKKLIDSRLVDYIALDVKAPLARYREITRSGVREEDIRKSIECVMSSGVDYEFRTTVVPSLLSPDDLRDIAQTISGARRLALQRFVPSKTLDPAFLNERNYPEETFASIADDIRSFVSDVIVR